MERVAIEIGIIIVIYLIGYRMGFRACYNYLKEKLDEEKEKHGLDL